MGKQTPPILTETTVSNATLAEQAAQCIAENSAAQLADPAEVRQEFEQHLLYLAEAVQAKEESLFTDYMEWLQQQAGSNAGYLKAQLHCVRGVLEDHAPPEQAEMIAAYLTTAASCVDNTCDRSGVDDTFKRTDDYVVLDFAGTWHLTPKVELYGKVDNVLDDQEIVSRSPAGARPNKPRTAYIGTRLRF